MKNHCLYRYCRYSWHSDKTPGAQRLSLLLLVLAMSICWYFFQGSPVDKSWQFRELLQIPHQIGAELCVLSNCCLCLCHVRNIPCWLLFSLRFIYGFGDQKTGHRFGEELGMRKRLGVGSHLSAGGGFFGGNLANPFKVLVASPHHWG